MSRPSTARAGRGFTLLEVLVVLLVMGLLVACVNTKRLNGMESPHAA